MDIEKILKELTIEEKAMLCMGDGSWKTVSIDRLNIPSIRMADGPHGVRKQDENEENNINTNESIPATCFPPAAHTSCSFDRNLIYEMGEAIADEAILQDVDIILGPAVNIKRSPLCGRNFEYISEDPYLTGEYASAFINGVQSRGVGTSIKHFAVNNQETLRMNINAVVDERALREIYLYAFEKAVKNTNPFTVMASYNRINGDYSCENMHLLKRLLRSEWGYKGLVISDWSAINNRVNALNAGCDLEMPDSGDIRTGEIINAIKSGVLDESTLDDGVRNVLRLVDKCTSRAKIKKENIFGYHNELAGQIAAKSMVLLKNEGSILPLSTEKSYALIGAFADTPRFQGGGSSHIKPSSLVSFKNVCEERKLNFTYCPGYEINSENINDKLIFEAVKSASTADICILLIGLTDIYEFEGVDRENMSIPSSHKMLIDEVYKVNPNIIVVLCAGSAVDTEWDVKCRGLLYAGVMGQAGSKAIYDILFGNVNPSGRLSETFPLRLSDTPCYHNFPGGNNSVYYMESIYVGYRYYSTAKIPVKYPFGFGLSYTSFEYSSFKADRTHMTENICLNLKVKVKNTGRVDGAEVVQIYIKNATQNTFTPEIVLKNFEKVFLKNGEEKEVIFKINYEDFMRYDLSSGWTADTGIYQIFAGSSSEDLRQAIFIHVEGKGTKQPESGIYNYFHVNDNNFDYKQFIRLYGRELSPLDIIYKPIGMNTPLAFCTSTLTGKLLFKAGKWVIAKSNPGNEGFAARKALTDSLGDNPIRSMVVMNKGTNLMTGRGLVKIMNGQCLSGMKDIIKSLKK